MSDTEFNTDFGGHLARLNHALVWSCSDNADTQTRQDHFVRVLNDFRDTQRNLSARLARQFNKHAPLLQLEADIVHELLHRIETASFHSLRQTSSVLRRLIDQTILVTCNGSGPPSCRHVHCMDHFSADVILRKTRVFDELRRRLPSAARVTLQLLSGEWRKSSVKLWTRICAGLTQPVPLLQELVLLNTMSMGQHEDSPPMIPIDVFAGLAPSLRTATIHRIGLHLPLKGSAMASTFAALTSLDYTPPAVSMTYAELADLLAALPQLTALSLRLIDMRQANTELAPIPHRLQALRIDYLQRGQREVYRALCNNATTLRRFEVRCRTVYWEQYLNVQPEQHRELAVGLKVTELDVASSGSGLEKLRFYHCGGPEVQLLAVGARWLTKLTLHHLLWPGDRDSHLPRAHCLTDLHLLMSKCSTVVTSSTALSADKVQDIFLAGKETAWRVPALRRFSLSYTLSKPEDRCIGKHQCCRRGRMLISAEVVAKTISELLIFKRERLDEIQLSRVELYEAEPTALSILGNLAIDIVQTSQLVDSVATMHLSRRLPPLKV